MDLQNIKIKSGERLDFVVYRADPEAINVTFTAKSDTKTFSDTLDYNDDGEAFFSFDSPDTDVIGVYDYQINENFAEGSPDIYPDTSGCEDDCELPTLEICPSLTGAA